MMLLPAQFSSSAPPKRPPVKRQSFSIDSLAISSHAEEDSVDPARDTDSPYLTYLEQSRSPPSLDHNANDVANVNNVRNVALQKHLPFMESRVKCANFIVNQQMETPAQGKTSYRHSPYGDHSMTTSTPKETSCKRRRLCSTSTPPSSDDSNGDDKLVIDTSVLTGDKLSPGSGSVASDDLEGDSTCSDGSLQKRGSKKLRTAFTGDQLRELERRYKTQKYLTAGDRARLANSLGLKDQQVKTWFQNRRMKEKRQQRDEESAQGFALPTGGVDVAQLAALGIYSPAHIGAQLGSPNPLNFHFNSPPSPMDPRVPSSASGGSSIMTSPGVTSGKSPVPEALAHELQDIYRTGNYLQSGQASSQLLAGHMHGLYSSAFASVVPSRYSPGSFSSPLLKGHAKST